MGILAYLTLKRKIKSKPFSVLVASNVIGALRRLFTETRMVLTARIAHSFTFSIKGGFYSESAIRFFRSPNLQNKIFRKTILSLKFEFVVYCFWWEI